jgi:hypothetical protein
MFMIQEPKVQHLHEKLLDHENRMLERILADAVGAGGTSGAARNASASHSVSATRVAAVADRPASP